MISLKLVNPTWIDGSADNPNDHCAHGGIEFVIDGLVISDGSEEYTTSGAALYLLRSVFFNHSEKDSLAEGNLIFPCCAFTPYKMESKYGVVVVGCPNGLHFEIKHIDSAVEIAYGQEIRKISVYEWASAVVSFSNQVLNFYADSSPKNPLEDKESVEGWDLFWSELQIRKNEASKIAEQA